MLRLVRSECACFAWSDRLRVLRLILADCACLPQLDRLRVPRLAGRRAALARQCVRCLLVRHQAAH
ncbi:hypothetical protein C0Z16_06430 [Paraburkholderia rhynchosiae]|uniref:Uncharacterized protein n=1 Tax=Paraburkholderia rhynchosiae TaxID=487049 RepID=A0ABX4VEC9_9BURK|nr:hypothetical protein C0Z16_06430 [Paraburkholderia rhynchosiae]